MLAILSGILGFATSGLPSILGFFQQRGDQKHERDMAKLQNEQAMAMAQANGMNFLRAGINIRQNGEVDAIRLHRPLFKRAHDFVIATSKRQMKISHFSVPIV